jgi:nitrile hydratase
MAYAGAPARREITDTPAFAIGDRVLVSHSVPVHHTRKAGYVRGAVGIVTALHGGYVFPDTNASGGGEAPSHVYSVRFTAEELFGEGIGDRNTVNTIELWEPYLSLVNY